MKKLLLGLVVIMLAGPARAWVYPGSTADNPLITRYITNLYTNTLLPLTPNTGQLGTQGNAWNSSHIDTAFIGTTNSYYWWLNSTELILQGIASLKANGFSTQGAMKQTGSGGIWANFSSGKLQLSGYSVSGSGITTGDTIMTFAKRGGAATLLALDSLGNVNMITGNLTLDATGSSVSADTLSGYNGNTWAVNSWGITITGIDTLAKFYMSSFDSTKFVRVWGNIKSVSSGGNPDTLVYMDSLKTDSIKITIAVGVKWLAPAVINKKWPTNPGGVVNPVYCIFRKGATTAAANMQFFTAYGMAKGRVF